jgi:hypothetical protein
MENLELIFENIMVNDVERIIKWMKFEENNICTSHFFRDNRDLEYQDITSFADYFQNMGTCNLLVKNLDIGIPISKGVIIISFDEIYGDLSLNFSEEVFKIEKEREKEILESILSKLNVVKNQINYSSIFFGYEPAEDKDMQLLTLLK